MSSISQGRTELEQVAHKQALSSVLKALDVIDALASIGRPTTLKDLSAQLGRPVGSTHRLLRTLELRGYVQSAAGRYRLTMKMWEIGESVISNIDVVDEARPVCQELCDRLQETVNLAIRSGTSAVYVSKLESPRSLALTTRLGLHVPVYCTALGKALTAFEPESVREAVLEQIEFKPHLKNTITDVNTFRTELEFTRRRGYAVDDEEFDHRVVCISAPLFNHTGRVAAAISLSGPRDRITPESWAGLGMQVKTAADEISVRLGYFQKEANTPGEQATQVAT